MAVSGPSRYLTESAERNSFSTSAAVFVSCLGWQVASSLFDSLVFTLSLRLEKSGSQSAVNMDGKTYEVDPYQPILVRPEYSHFVNAIVSGLLGFKNITFEDNQTYSLNKASEYLLGLNVFQVTGILGLAFLASIVFVAIILPNMYFKLLLDTDAHQDKNKERLDLILADYQLDDLPDYVDSDNEIRLDRTWSPIEDARKSFKYKRR